MARTGSDNMSFKRHPNQGKVANYIQEFMPGRFVVEAQFKIIQNAFLQNGDLRLVKVLG